MTTANRVGTSAGRRDGDQIIAGRYRILRRLAVGATSEVYLAEGATPKSRVVVKLLAAHGSQRQVRAEFARLTELAHPHVVRVHDAGTVLDEQGRERAFIVMDHIAGRSLAEALASKDKAHRSAAFFSASEALADALAYIHARGICHGDISPANVRCTDDDNPVLIDFGLSLLGGQSEPTASASGTLGFIAPEALLGERGQAGDLFSLAATLYHAWCGNAPFGVGIEAASRIWQGPPPLPSALREGLPEAWDRLLLSTLAPNIEDRPSSARELLRAIRMATPGRDVPLEAELAIPNPAGDPLAGVMVGRSAEGAALRRHLAQLADGAATVGVIWVVGPVGSGRHTLIRRALREARLAMLAGGMASLDIEETDCARLLSNRLGGDGPGSTAPVSGLSEAQSDDLSAGAGRMDELSAQAMSEPLQRSQTEIAALLAGLEGRSVARPLCLALDGAAEDQALAEAFARGPQSGRVLLLVPCRRGSPGSGAAVIDVPPLSREAIAELARRGAGVEPPQQIVEHIRVASGGLAGAVALLVRGWIASVRSGKPLALDGKENAEDLAALFDESFSSLGRPAQLILVNVAMGLEIGHDNAGLVASEARAAGWLLSDANALPSALHAEALWRAVSRDPVLQTAVRIGIPKLSPDDERLAAAKLALGGRSEAADAFWAAARAAERKLAWGRVSELGCRALEASAASGGCEDRLALANALGIVGDYQRALQVLDGCPPAAPAIATSIVERKAWLLGRQGKSQEAAAIVGSALAQLPAGSDEALLLRGRLARLLVSIGRFSDAFSVAEPALASDGAAGLGAREAAVLALAYGGHLIEAARLLGKLPRDEEDPSTAARLAALDGLVHQMAGEPLLATKDYRAALSGYERSRDLHGAAAAAFNLGCALAEIGDYGAAEEALEHAIRDLGRLHSTTDYVLAVFNVGQLFLQLGDLDATGRALARLADVASSGESSFRGYELLLAGDLAKRRRVAREAAQSYAQASELLVRMGMRSMANLAELGRAEVLSDLGQHRDAREMLARVSTTDEDSSTTEACLIARARIELADATSPPAVAVEIAESLAAAYDRVKAAGRLPAAWRLASLGFRLFGRVGDPRQVVYRESARSVFSEVLMKTPAKHWTVMQSDPDARVLDLRPDVPVAGAQEATRLALLEGRLRRLLRINKRLNSDLRLSRVLETIIDTVIELTDAERGFLLLKDGSGELVVKVARNIDQTTLEGPGLSLSRSIAKRAAETGQPVVTVDAADDSRFSEMLSVSDLHLRSVLAVPLSVKGSVVGTIYVDHRLRKGVFGDDEVALVLDFAEQGAIAIENVRVLSELRRREQQVQSLNRRLEEELRLKEAALDDARIELKESRQVAALRYDYRQIVGQSPAMLEIFRLLDRVTDTHLPVVVEGESGTGKELVARAIHFHGPRKDRAFVSENCAAIPETLLESTLFGHVRGAFTGADRDSRGLFAVANGGTLFLDEVGEMSPAMQGKLLRVLQDGEYHRVGGERPERSDVRIVAATNKNLAQMVEDGKFRKDLFYRLSVVRIHLPPLRERREDIPMLLKHFLDKAAQASGGTPKSVDPTAIDKLCGYGWPGNVRELENEIARAGAFAGASIGVVDLSPHIQAGQDAVETVRSDSDGLRLRHRVERLERHLIREAMSRSQGNQTKAAALLGLSRFGLQKKLRRYSLSG